MYPVVNYMRFFNQTSKFLRRDLMCAQESRGSWPVGVAYHAYKEFATS